MRLELTRRADYAVRAMLALAARDGEIVSGGRIAAAMGIPPRFIAQVMSDLSAAGLVAARTGRRGGYVLLRPPADVSMLAIVEAVEGDARRRTCVLRSVPCSPDGKCAVHDMFAAAQDALLDRLAAATLDSADPLAPPAAPR
jgi:Rrf2 family transcriptional regulator, iron-sulfur cluster assembly transcription factor